MVSLSSVTNHVLSFHFDCSHFVSAADAENFIKFLFFEVKNRLISAVISQQLTRAWAPLSKAYKAHKVRYGLNSGMWVATEKLINSLCLDISVGSDFVFARILCHPGQFHNGVPMWKIAKYLEYGTRRIPPRPLFRPIAESIHHDMLELLKSYSNGEEYSVSASLSYLTSSVGKFIHAAEQ